MTAAIAGAGAAGGVRVVRWDVVRRILVVWILTPLACGLAAAALFGVLRLGGV